MPSVVSRFGRSSMQPKGLAWWALGGSPLLVVVAGTQATSVVI